MLWHLYGNTIILDRLMSTTNLTHLNPEQHKAVTHLGTPLLVLAGAGSGKTGVITHKIAWLIEQAGIEPHHIAALTFTNKAANEMKQRVNKLLKNRSTRGLRVSTFHTLGLDIVRRESKLLGFKGAISIYDARDTLSILAQLAQDTPFEQDTATLRQQISHWKSQNLTPESIIADATDAATLAAANIYAKYVPIMLSYNAVDFDDLIRLPLQLFEAHPDALARWQSKIRYLLVDEYQDTNNSQYELVKILVGHRNGFTAVGDDDQSIYAWRGANPEHMAGLRDDFPNLEIIPLEQNYRSTARILRIANHLISENTHIFDKTLWSDLGEGPKIQVSACQDDEHEAERVVAHITTHKIEMNKQFSDFAILYRSNYQSRALEQQLRLAGLPYQISGGTSFFEYAEIKDLMSYFKVLLNPNDDTAFRRIANVPKRELGPTTLEKLSRYASERNLPISIAALEVKAEKALGQRAQSRVRSLLFWLDDIRDRLKQAEEPVTVLREMLEEMRFDDYLSAESNSPKGFERKQKNVNDLLNWLLRLNEKSLNDTGETMSFEERVNRIALLDRLDRQNEENQTDAITLMTLHTAKGLEFDHVHIIGFEEELLPHKNSLETGMLEEERRLAYVGITRAKRQLHITYAQRRRRGKNFVECDPSRFLSELPQADIHFRAIKEAPSQAENQAARDAHLADLQKLLG